MDKFIVDNKNIDMLSFLKLVNNASIKLELSCEVARQVEESRKLLDKFVHEGRIIYGVNTSMGGFVNYVVPVDLAEKLQLNLLHSVASNVGDFFDDKIVRAVMIARFLSLSKGVSAISLRNLNVLKEMIDREIYPCIPRKGSLGSSGDLGPLAFIALVGTGKWKAKYNGKILSGEEAMRKAGIEKMRLGYKEGLALINGTSAMTALAALNIKKARQLFEIYLYISSLSFEGLATKIKPFDIRVHKRKQHSGQLYVAKKIYGILKNSKMIVDENKAGEKIKDSFEGKVKSVDNQIEDAYSIRCTPQILGPICDTLDFVEKIIVDELNSSSDNPLVIPEHKEVFHNGHFHGQYISMAMDYLAICMTTISNLSDRRIDRFMDATNSNGLPAFLCRETPGLRLGFMGGQFMSTSVTAENRSLCVPLSIQSLTSTGDFQDIVSFGLVASRRAEEIIDNAGYILSFELLCACQAVDIRDHHKISPVTNVLYKKIRKNIPYCDKDVIITDHCDSIKNVIFDDNVLNELQIMSAKNDET